MNAQPHFGQDPATRTASTGGPIRYASRVRRLAWAGIVYVLAWIIGLFLARGVRGLRHGREL